MSIALRKTFAELPDQDLVEEVLRSGHGNQGAYRELIRRHQGMVYTNCRYLTGQETESEDLAQEVLVKAYFNLGSFEQRSTFKTWLQRIKVNHCLNHLRKEKSRPSAIMEVEAQEDEAWMPDRLDPALAEESHASSVQATTDVEKVLGMMPEILRVPLILCDLDGFLYREAADELEIGMSTLKMRLKRARECFKVTYQSISKINTKKEVGRNAARS